MFSDKYCKLGLFLVIVFSSNSYSTYDFCEIKEVEVCVDDTNPRFVDGFEITRPCWEWKTVYTCYEDEISTNCSPEQLAIPTTEIASVDEVSNTGRNVRWSEIKVPPLDCAGGINTEFGCSDWYEIDDGDPMTVDADGITCYTEEKDTCEPDDCRVITQECTNYVNGICNQEIIKYDCSTGNVCAGPQGLAIESDNESNFNEAIAQHAMMDVISSSGTVDPATGEIRLFQGQSESCIYVSDEYTRAAVATGTALTIVAYVFGGPLGVLSAPVSAYALALANGEMNCCANDPDDIDPAKSFGLCRDDHKELAIARMTNRTVALGGKMVNTYFCSDVGTLSIYVPWSEPLTGTLVGDGSELCHNPYPQEMKPQPWPPGPLAREEPQSWKRHYCMFDDLLSKVIQEQGRKQFEEILARPALVNQKQTGFKLHSYYGSPGWGSAVNVNGNLVAFWTWDEACNEDDSAMSGNNTGSIFGNAICPGVPNVVAAICSKEDPGECGVYPTTPLEFNEAWDLKEIVLEDEGETSLNQYATAEVECYTDNSCNIDLAAWPAASGPELMQKTELVWQRSFPYPEMDPGKDLSFNVFTGGLTTLDIQMLTAIRQGVAEPDPTIRVRPIGATDWEEFVLPTRINNPNYSVTMTNGTQLFITGGCNSFACNYMLARKIIIQPKPWYTDTDHGSRRHCLFRLPSPIGCVDRKRKHRRPTREGHCEGFTLDEFTILDFNQMDLSEYTDTISDRANDAILKWIDSNAP